MGWMPPDHLHDVRENRQEAAGERGRRAEPVRQTELPEISDPPS